MVLPLPGGFAACTMGIYEVGRKSEGPPFKYAAKKELDGKDITAKLHNLFDGQAMRISTLACVQAQLRASYVAHTR